MVLQMPCPEKKFVFVASSLEDRQQAESEIVTWASSHGYRLPAADRIFALYSEEALAREWRLLERRTTDAGVIQSSRFLGDIKERKKGGPGGSPLLRGRQESRPPMSD